MTLLLLALVFYLLSTSNNRQHTELAEQIGAGVAITIGSLVALFVVLFGWFNYPLTTKVLLCVGGLILLAVIARSVYRRFFSPAARIRAGYKGMRDCYYKLIRHVLDMEKCKSSRTELDYQRQRGLAILNRYRQRLELYTKLPPEERMDGFYATQMVELEQRLHKATGSAAPAGS